MKIIDAVWEKRNLFLETKEIEVEEGDTLEDLEAVLKEATEEYVVVKMPALTVDKSFLLAKYGYAYIETLMSIDIEPDGLYPMSQRQQEIHNQTKVALMTAEQRAAALRWVAGGVFQTDRISLDPYFSQDLANRRYIGWLVSEAERGTEFLELQLKGDAIGFIAVKELRPDVYNAFLSCIYGPHQGKGYAFMGTTKVLEVYNARGAKYYEGWISNNNLKSLRRSLSSGCKITRMCNVYVKHNLPHEEYLKRIEPHKDTLVSEAMEWIG